MDVFAYAIKGMSNSGGCVTEKSEAISIIESRYFILYIF